jgi:hypothetical protein
LAKELSETQIVTISRLLDGTETINAQPQINSLAMAVREGA